MDFFQISTKETRGGVLEVRPDFTVGRSKDLMVRGGMFYAIWDPEKGLWSTDEYDVQRLVDEAIKEYVKGLEADGIKCTAKFLRSFGTNGWSQFRKFMKNVSDNSTQLDMKLTFSNTEVKKSDHVSRRLPYALAPGDHSAWDELVGYLYDPEERAKIEWAIGSIMSGDSKKIEKFLVFYGPGGTGKSTIMKIIQKLFEGYYATFEAKALVGSNNSFATEAFKSNPLVAIQHDGDLSKIEDNSKLNSIVGHDEMLINEKYKPGYMSRINAFLFMGTNKPVKITDAKSGLIRRLIDVKPTGNTFEPDEYFALMSRIEFELGAIAQHCLDVYRSMGKNYYNGYRPLDMMLQTDVFFNFIEAYYDVLKEQDGISLRQAYALWKEYVKDAELEYKLPQHRFREELKNYFTTFTDRVMINGSPIRSYYTGFSAQPFKTPVIPKTTPPSYTLIMDETESIFDETYADQPAQGYKIHKESGREIPRKYWTDEERLVDGEMVKPKPSQVCSTTLKDIDTTKVHFVKVPENHIVIDFDLKDENGEKSLKRNLLEASHWPPTYAEISKSGSGVHLHYNYEGEVKELAQEYSPGVEVKTLLGDASLRRKLTKCNNIPVATISSGLPFKEKKQQMLHETTLKSEKGLRDLILRNLRKEIHPGTKPSIDFIHKILDDAYKSGMQYDVTDLRPRIMAFANNSSNQALTCLKTVQKMQFRSDGEEPKAPDQPKDDRVVFYDVEVYPNLFIVCWKYEGAPTTVRMLNPTPQQVEGLFQFKLVGFNNRRYDNHILYARYMGYSNEELYKLSQKIINNSPNALFGEAYNLSYADIYDFSSKKQGLKKFQIELGLPHVEMDIPWDEDVPEDKWDKVMEYCVNDVESTEKVFEARRQDFIARQILADLSGLPVNATTQKHTARIIFGNDPAPQRSFIYTDLSKEFPGYVYDMGKSTSRDELVGEGGYVYAEPGMYENVAVLDVASMHPTSIIQLNLFGEYTDNFKDLVDTRIAIKHKDYDAASTMLGGKLAPYLVDREGVYDIAKAEELSYALKIVINIVYGLTSAKFDNPFRDIRNKDNIVAKRGALFMIDLKHAVQEQGFQVVHIKTDSIKIPNATDEIIQFVTEFGKKYGYDFEHEATYDKFCLVNDAVYIAKTQTPIKNGPYKGQCWSPVGAQFQHPYVYKTLFSGQPVQFEDLCEAKSVTAPSAMYLDFDEEKATPAERLDGMHHVGRTGLFVPVFKEASGGKLLRVKDGKTYSVGGTKDFYWLEAEMIRKRNDFDVPFFDLAVHPKMYSIDMGYFNRLADEAVKTINKFGDFWELVK